MDSDAQQRATIGMAGFVAGGALAAATVTYILWPRDQDVAHGVRVRPAVTAAGARLAIGASF